MATKTKAPPPAAAFGLNDAMNIAADGAVGFVSMSTILDCIASLSKTDAALAERLARVGSFIADGLEAQMQSAQDAIEAAESTDRAGKGATTAPLVEGAADYCESMNAFFDLAEREIRGKNTTDFDNIEFLLNGAKAELFRFGALVVAQKGGAA